MPTLNDEVLKDLLERVRKLEQGSKDSKTDEAILNMDHALFTTLVASNALAGLLVEKKVITEDDLRAAAVKEQTRLAEAVRKGSERVNDQPDTTAKEAGGGDQGQGTK